MAKIFVDFPQGGAPGTAGGKLNTPTGATFGDIIYLGLTADTTVRVARGTAEGQVYRNSILNLPEVAYQGVIDHADSEYVTGSSGTTVLPNDGTQPQNTEGFQIMSVSYVPKSTSTDLEIEAWAQLGTSNSLYAVSAALFRTGVTGALAASSWWANNANTFSGIYLRARIATPATSSQTFTVRAGPTNSAATVYFNKKPATGVDFFATSINSWIRVREIAR